MLGLVFGQLLDPLGCGHRAGLISDIGRARQCISATPPIHDTQAAPSPAYPPIHGAIAKTSPTTDMAQWSRVGSRAISDHPHTSASSPPNPT